MSNQPGSCLGLDSEMSGSSALGAYRGGALYAIEKGAQGKTPQEQLDADGDDLSLALVDRAGKVRLQETERPAPPVRGEKPARTAFHGPESRVARKISGVSR